MLAAQVILSACNETESVAKDWLLLMWATSHSRSNQAFHKKEHSGLLLSYGYSPIFSLKYSIHC